MVFTFTNPTTAASSAVVPNVPDALSLVARAVARTRFPDLRFEDPAAESLLAKLGLAVMNESAFEERHLRATLVRTMVIDRLVASFFARHPEGLAIAVFPGLCTRFSRVDNGELRWLDVEEPHLAKEKVRLLEDGERHMVVASCSVQCSGWLAALREARDVPTMLVAQGGPLHTSGIARDAFLVQAVRELPTGTELVVDYDARTPVRPTSIGKAFSSLEAQDETGAWSRYPRLRFVPFAEYEPRLQHELGGLNAVSRLFRGRGMPSVAHLRFS